MEACNICGSPRAADVETARVRCNVRRFAAESFPVWRCKSCRSIHADVDVDLAHYYAGYPVHAASLNWMLRVTYANLLKRLQRAGLQPGHRVLDYGCGQGLLVQFLKEQGYAQTVGYDPFTEPFRDRAVLQERYDCIVSQDVIEHVDDPRAFLEELSRLALPGAIVSIGTPDAAALDLADAEDFVHALHQPYHRHILSADALREAGARRGWTLSHYYSTMYNNTLVPTMNPRFALHYVRCHDDVFDLVSEPIRIDSPRLFSPVTLFFALFGYFFDRHTDVQAVFRVPLALPEVAS